MLVAEVLVPATPPSTDAFANVIEPAKFKGLLENEKLETAPPLEFTTVRLPVPCMPPVIVNAEPFEFASASVRLFCKLTAPLRVMP